MQGWFGSGGGTHRSSNKKIKIFTWKEFNTRNFKKGYHSCIKKPNTWRNIFWRIYQNNTCFQNQGFKSPTLIEINLYQASPMEDFANKIWIYSNKITTLFWRIVFTETILFWIWIFWKFSYIFRIMAIFKFINWIFTIITMRKMKPALNW